jgi:hypothetical protein
MCAEQRRWQAFLHLAKDAFLSRVLLSQQPEQQVLQVQRQALWLLEQSVLQQVWLL